jgi:hypothetical protein
MTNTNLEWFNLEWFTWVLGLGFLLWVLCLGFLFCEGNLDIIMRGE